MKILYLHGLGSKPGGVKPSFLRAEGHEVVNPALPDDDFERSVRIAQEAFDADRPEIVVGSSRGGAVAIALDTRGIPLVLIAPAWKRWGRATRLTTRAVILHSANDDVISFADSQDLVEASELPPSALVEVGADHNMIDEGALGALTDAIDKLATT